MVYYGSMGKFEGFEDVSLLQGAGVYLLCKKGEVVYVGQSRSLWRRVYEHKNMAKRKRGQMFLGHRDCKAMNFDEIHIMACAIGELDRLEKELIAKHVPKYNVTSKAKIALPASVIDAVKKQLAIDLGPPLPSIKRPL